MAFAHRSFQEYLTAEYLKAHQSRSSVVQSLVMVGNGSTRHALPRSARSQHGSR